MKENVCEETTGIEIPKLARRSLILSAALMALAYCAVPAQADGDRGERYRQTNLVSDQPGMALLQDTNLLNAWGISSSPTSPVWISDNGSGLSTLYAVTYTNGVVHVAKVGLEVTIPGDGVPTGQLFDGTGSFKGDIFIFAGEDGTISGWHGSLGKTAELLVQRSNAVYKGIALVTTSNGPALLAANFREGTLDAYGTNLTPTGQLTLLGQFSDMHAPTGYAPFNVSALAGSVFVTFAKQDAAKHDDVKGPGNGLIDMFNPMTGAFHRFATGSDAGGRLRAINSPWGLAVSPKSFGRHEDELLVGNFGSGTIMGFEADGDFRGVLIGEHGGPVVIDGLWGLRFGIGGNNGRPETLYFTAGPNDESDGLFGSLDPITNKHGAHEGHDRDDGNDGNGDNGDHGGDGSSDHGD